MSNIKIINGKELADKLLENQKLYLDKHNDMRRPYLVVITIGKDDASNVYVRNKQRACERCDIIFENVVFDENCDIQDVKDKIQKLNDDSSIDGIIVQQPVPDIFRGIEQLVTPNKDVDGFTTYNLGGTLNNIKHISACTPNGIMELLHYNDITLEGKHVVVIGRSNIVGKPLIGMLLSKNATVTSCNSHTENLELITGTADIIITAIGKPKYIHRDFLTSKCKCIIDVGMNRDSNGKLCGDVDYSNIIDYWNKINDDEPRYITPVPGGVGPMTVYSLIKNTNIAYCENVLNTLLGGIL